MGCGLHLARCFFWLFVCDFALPRSIHLVPEEFVFAKVCGVVGAMFGKSASHFDNPSLFASELSKHASAASPAPPPKHAAESFGLVCNRDGSRSTTDLCRCECACLSIAYTCQTSGCDASCCERPRRRQSCLFRATMQCPCTFPFVPCMCSGIRMQQLAWDACPVLTAILAISLCLPTSTVVSVCHHLLSHGSCHRFPAPCELRDGVSEGCLPDRLRVLRWR